MIKKEQPKKKKILSRAWAFNALLYISELIAGPCVCESICIHDIATCIIASNVNNKIVKKLNNTGMK